ncbi:MAG: WG repeat-containing protein [Bacteroidia bacterium]
MTKFTSLLMAGFIMPFFLYAQKPNVVIEEDYTKPDKRLYLPGDEYHKRSIENGLYICKPAALPASLDFGFRFDPYNNPQEKNNAKEASDLDFTIIKMKGSKESFISVGFNYLYLKFSYNALGQWKWANYNDDKTYMEGTAAVNADTNLIRISYRIGSIRCYINGTEAMRYTFEKEQSTQYLRWENAQVFTKDKKMVLALDKVVLTGYPSYAKYPEEEAQAAAIAAEKIKNETPAPPDPNEVIDYNKVYEPQPDTDIEFFRDKFEIWGIKNLKGEVLCPPKYDHFEGFYGGVSFVWGKGGAALIDRTGKELTPYQYSNFNDFSEGVALVSSDCDENGENCKYSYIDKTGKTVLELPAKYASAGSFYDGLAVVSAIVEGNGEAMSDYRYGYIDITGKEVIPPTFTNAGDFRYNRAPVESEDYKVGYINKAGKLVIPYKYYKMGDMKDYLFSEGLAAVFVKDELKSEKYNTVHKYGYIDVNGKEVIPLKYNMVSDFKNGVAVVYNRTGQYTGQLYYTKKGLIDKTGKELTPIKYDDMGEFSEGLALVSVNRPNSNFADKYGYIDQTGKEVIPLIYNDAKDFSEGLAYVEHSCSTEYPYPCKKSFIDKTGKLVFNFEYSVDILGRFSEGLISVFECKEVNGEEKCKWGFMDKTGKLVIPLKYDNVESFAGGLAIVELNGEYFRVDYKGTEIKGGKNPYGEEGDY